MILKVNIFRKALLLPARTAKASSALKSETKNLDGKRQGDGYNEVIS
jgi:hypothetical protein